jgi:uncharacterized OsmC-like protein
MRTNLEELSERLRTEPDFGHVWPKVSTSLVGDVMALSRFAQYGKEFEFRSDEAKARGGHGEAPSPLRYFLSSIAFCQQGFYAKSSSITGVVLDGLDINVLTYMDMRGEHKVTNAPVHPQWIVVEAKIKSPSADRNVLAMVDEANARCPITNLVRRAVPVYEQIHLNGRLIRDTAPPDIDVNWNWRSPR